MPPALLAKLVAVAAIWGGTFIAGRVASLAMAAPAAALWRYLVASVALLAFVAWRERGLPRLSREQWLGVTLLGATGVAAYNLFFMFGLERVPASRGSLIMALNPAMIMLGGALFLGERLTPARVAGVVLALVGVTIVLGHGNPLELFAGHVGIGELALFGCVLSWCTYTLVGKRVLAGLSPLVATTYAALTGTVLLALACAISGDLAWPPAKARGVGVARVPRRARHRGGVRLVLRRRDGDRAGAHRRVHQPGARVRDHARRAAAGRARRGVDARRRRHRRGRDLDPQSPGRRR